MDGVVNCTPAQAAAEIVGECGTLGILRVWMHRAIGQGSVSDAAGILRQQNKISVIAGVCPMMYCRLADIGLKYLHWMMVIFGKLPHQANSE